VHADSRGTYGARRVHAELVLGRGVSVGHGVVEMLMRQAGISGITGRPKWRHAKPGNIARDLVGRCFTRASPDQLWVTDITEHPTYEGKVCCCVMLDACSRRVVGWSIDGSPTAALVTSALGMAHRQPSPQPRCADPLRPGNSVRVLGLHRPGQGIGLVPSMGSVGDCYDKACVSHCTS
jgi:putative transposase